MLYVFYLFDSYFSFRGVSQIAKTFVFTNLINNILFHNITK